MTFGLIRLHGFGDILGATDRHTKAPQNTSVGSPGARAHWSVPVVWRGCRATANTTAELWRLAYSPSPRRVVFSSVSYHRPDENSATAKCICTLFVPCNPQAIRLHGLVVAEGLLRRPTDTEPYTLQLTEAMPDSFPLIAPHHVFYPRREPYDTQLFFRITAPPDAGEAAFVRDM